MIRNTQFDVIIIGGSYSGLAAALALGRSLRKVLVVDSGKPCNRFTPTSHNFLTQDGKAPGEIADIARNQLLAYDTVHFLTGMATSAVTTKAGFEVTVDHGEKVIARKLIFATGIQDITPKIEGLPDCWGISVLHCPYCHGYEVRHQPTGILGNGEYGYEFSSLLSNWTGDLTLFTNGPSTLTPSQAERLHAHDIKVVEKEIVRLEHVNGHLQRVNFRDGTTEFVNALYTRPPFKQHSDIPETLGCELTEEGYIKVDAMQMTTVRGVFASGDNTARMRTVANAVATGTMAGMAVNKEMILEDF